MLVDLGAHYKSDLSYNCRMYVLNIFQQD